MARAPPEGWQQVANDIEVKRWEQGSLAMLTTDDLACAAEMVVGRVSPRADEPDAPCLSNHLAIARAGVEEGLKLALRLLRDGDRSTPESDSGCDHDQRGDLVSIEIAAGESPGRG
jgi:hypothetical protein